MLKKIFFHFAQGIAIDLGTANSLVYLKEHGIVMTEPSVVAINQKTGQILAIGEEAKKMVGRTPSYIIASRPLRAGVISDFEVTEQMLRYFIEKVRKRRFIFGIRPYVIIGIPSGVTEVEKKAVKDAAINAGAGEVFLIDEPMAAAIGARLPVQEAGGNFIIDIGGGTTEVAVISLGGIVVSKSLRIAGDKLNEDIIQFVQEEYKLLIGERMAETAKIRIGSVCSLNKDKKNKKVDKSRKKSGKKSGNKNDNSNKDKKEMALRGRNLITGLPEEVIISENDISLALEKSIKQIISEIKDTVEKTPPELLSDIMSKGICLAGGGSQLRGLADLIAKETKIPTKVIEDPMTAVVRGAGMVLEKLGDLQDVLAEVETLEPPK